MVRVPERVFFVRAMRYVGLSRRTYAYARDRYTKNRRDEEVRPRHARDSGSSC